MTYFHPRDFDADQPIIPGLTKYRKFKSYYGIQISQTKLEHIIECNSFSTLEDLEVQLKRIKLT